MWSWTLWAVLEIMGGFDPSDYRHSWSYGIIDGPGPRHVIIDIHEIEGGSCPSPGDCWWCSWS